MELLPSFAMLLLVLLLHCERLPRLKAQSTSVNGSSRSEAKALDALLQDNAYKALSVNPKTGTVFNGAVPSNLTGVKDAALRLRSGSLKRRGYGMYKEFEIPTGLEVSPYVERLVLVYQNLGNWSNTYYPLPNYTYLAPVLGLLAYDAKDLSATNLPELQINASGDPILIKFEGASPAPVGAVAKCVWFDLQGSSNFSNVTGGNTCSTRQQGHFSIVVESTAPAPSPAPSPGAPAPAPAPAPSAKGKKKKSKDKVWIIVGCVLGALVLLLLLCLLACCVRKLKQKKKMQRMEKAAEAGVALHMTSVGNTRAPAASGTRTQPTLEHGYAP